MSSIYWLLVSLLFLAKAGLLWGHGRLLDPASRSSMWRVGFNTTANYDDNGLNCGGYGVQWHQNHGKCGVCGDPYDGPLLNEAGGKYATGQIVSDYIRGQDILVTVELTVNHGGFFEFFLCPVNNPKRKATEECFDRYPLSMTDGQRKYIVNHRKPQFMNIPVRLPPHLTCEQCVFRWKYVTATTWGCEAGRCCSGCGPQEEFYGCADIAIKLPPMLRPRTTPPSLTTRKVIKRDNNGNPKGPECRAKFPWRNNPTATPWCIEQCARGRCNKQYCEDSCVPAKKTPSVIERDNHGIPKRPECRAKLPWRNNPSATPWCIKQCAEDLCNRRYCEDSCLKGAMYPQSSLFLETVDNSFWDGIMGSSNETLKSLNNKRNS